MMKPAKKQSAAFFAAFASALAGISLRLLAVLEAFPACQRRRGKTGCNPLGYCGRLPVLRPWLDRLRRSAARARGRERDSGD